MDVFVCIIIGILWLHRSECQFYFLDLGSFVYYFKQSTLSVFLYLNFHNVYTGPLWFCKSSVFYWVLSLSPPSLSFAPLEISSDLCLSLLAVSFGWLNLVINYASAFFNSVIIFFIFNILVLFFFNVLFLCCYLIFVWNIFLRLLNIFMMNALIYEAIKIWVLKFIFILLAMFSLFFL